MAVEQLYAQLADEVGLALRDPAPRKLVVVHLMGAHPHYRVRHPDGANPFAGIDDAFERGRGAWMYLSDHGQEVGHELDRAGHSATTAAGYRIPALLWRSEGLPPQLGAQVASFTR